MYANAENGITEPFAYIDGWPLEIITKTTEVGDIGRYEDLTGRKFGRLTVLERAENRGNVTCWLCRCECGTEKVVRGSLMKNGHTSSCGCLRKEMMKKNMTKHGLSQSRFYRIWSAMLTRCGNSNDRCYYLYGGKGVKVVDRWQDFSNFKEDMYDKYLEHSREFGENNTSIDRIDSNGDYCPSNCEWATPLEQARNKSTKSGHKGVQKASRGGGWVANIGVGYKLIYLGHFTDIEDAIAARKEAEKIYWEE